MATHISTWPSVRKAIFPAKQARRDVYPPLSRSLHLVKTRNKIGLVFSDFLIQENPPNATRGGEISRARQQITCLLISRPHPTCFPTGRSPTKRIALHAFNPVYFRLASDGYLRMSSQKIKYKPDDERPKHKNAASFPPEEEIQSRAESLNSYPTYFLTY